MGSRAAITTGILAVALAAVPVAAPAATAADCTKGGGLLSGVTNSLCDVVDVVTDTVDGLTGNNAEPLTDGLDDTTGEVLGTVGEVAPTGKPSSSPAADPSPSKSADLLPKSLNDVCLPVLACGDQSVLNTLTPTPARSAEPSPSPTPSARPSKRNADTEVLPTDAATPPQSEPYLMDTQQPVEDRQTANPDEPRIDLLWPNPYADELSVPLRDRQVVRPSTPASDAIGTALTAALLMSAVLATRIVQQRRRREEEHASIPFEPGRAPGRHRLASF